MMAWESDAIEVIDAEPTRPSASPLRAEWETATCNDVSGPHRKNNFVNGRMLTSRIFVMSVVHRASKSVGAAGALILWK